MKPALAIIGSVAICLAVLGSSWRGAEAAEERTAKDGDRDTDQPAVEVTAYVPTTTHIKGRGLSVILEVKNNSPVPLNISSNAHSEKVFESQVKPLTPGLRNDGPADGRPEQVMIVAQTLYPPDTEMLAYSISGKRRKPTITPCGPGETVFVKIEVRKEVLQEGKCKLLFTLRAGPARVARDVARSQEIPIEAVAVDPRPAA